MIYLDNAATTFPKPKTVYNTVNFAMQNYVANPGRSGYKLSIEAAIEIYNCRKAISELFNAGGPENVMFTLNCTYASNMVLKGLLQPGDHVVMSSLEHNAVVRPLKDLEARGVHLTVAKVHPENDEETLNEFRKALNERTKLIVCMHASNVFGVKLPVSRIAAMGHQYGIPIMVDGAQSAGLLNIDVTGDKIDYLCLAGHKGLYGPMGTGVLVTSQGERLRTIIQGGTGINSISYNQPELPPEKFESGTPNMIGIAGLHAGVNFVRQVGVKAIFNHEFQLIEWLYDELKLLDKIELYTNRPNKDFYVPLLSFNVKNKSSEFVASMLNKNGIYVRAGLHCAPFAHEAFGTLEQGTVRVCPSFFTRSEEMRRFIFTIKKIISEE